MRSVSVRFWVFASLLSACSSSLVVGEENRDGSVLDGSPADSKAAPDQPMPPDTPPGPDDVIVPKEDVTSVDTGDVFAISDVVDVTDVTDVTDATDVVDASDATDACVPSPEACNNRDDDCDGVVDNGLMRTCYNGPAGTSGVGACRAGTQTCAAGAWGACVGQVLPTTEVCDGADNDCDGAADESFAIPSFQVRSLGATNCRVVDHLATTGDDHGGIAISSSGVLYTGDARTGRFSLDLATQTATSQQYDALTSNLASGRMYTFGAGSTPIPYGGGTATTLLEIDGATGALSGASVRLSAPLTLGSGSGIFAGAGRVVVHDGTRVHSIELPSGAVTTLGTVAAPPHASCESWAYWGVAEYTSGQLSIVYVRDAQTIERMAVPSGARSVVGTFTNLGDMCSFTVSPQTGRWYFHHEGVSQFGGTGETLGYCDASLSTNTSEGLGTSCTVGVGACARTGALVCSPTGVTCSATPGAATAEACNNVDDDCDGQTDEDLTRSCYVGPTGTAGVGACRAGAQTCAVGAWGACVGQVIPVTETCDNVDNDCNGAVDNGLTRTCYNGPAGTAGVGVCRAGTQTCAAGSWGAACPGEVTPSTERCNGADDNCNGTADEGAVACVVGVGACQRTSSRTVSCPVMGTESGAVGVTLGYQHACALLRDGTAQCWGFNGYGQLGNGTATNSRAPVTVAGLGDALDITGGYYFNCARLRTAGVRCWGYNGYGQLGDGSVINRATPVTVSALSDVVSLSAGVHHACAVRADGAALCWGYNFYGQLGDGTGANRGTPVRVRNVTDFTRVAAGGNHACGLRADGTVWCWGYNGYGQLGDGSTADRAMPVPVAGLTNVVELAAGINHTCARLGDGTLRCWGYNGNGQLGDGTTATRTTPVAVSGITNAAQITRGENHSCARLTDGSLRCWGYNGNGAIGDGTTTLRTTPAAVTGIVNATQVSAFYRTTCAVLADQTVRCWGDNGNGQVGDGTAVDRNTPVAVVGLTNLPACDVTPGAPTTETCNNVDDDCDGVVDESLTRTCYNGPAGTAGVGACRAGAQTCGGGAWSACAGEVLPRTEVCNGADDNCNGIRDEGLTCP